MDRETVLGLIKEKDDIENELKSLGDELKLQNNVGMNEELVDKEGYPRSVVLIKSHLIILFSHCNILSYHN